MAYKINDDLIEKIHESSDLVDIVSRYVQLKKSSNNYVGLCPFHNEKTPSFTVSESKQLFHCFGCGEGGDLITFIMKIENLSFVEAVKFLADLIGISIEEGSNEFDNKIKNEKEKIYKINKEAARFFYYNLRNTSAALKYLKDRNIEKKVINKFGLGYALDGWDSIYNYLREKGYSEEDIEKSGLIGKRKNNTGYYDKFRNRIMYPIIDIKDRVIGFGGRVLDNKTPKYLNSKDTLVFSKGNNLYGLNLIKKNSNREKIILVEGYMDVISLFNYGINYAVASLGTAFTQNQAKLLKRYAKQVYICFDSDNAGINATNKAFNILRKEGIKPKAIILPKNYDPDDFIKKNGLDEFKKLEDYALNYVDYRIYINKQKYELTNYEDKIKFTKEVAKTLRELKSPIEKDVYIDKVSMDTGISKEAIRREVLDKDSKSVTTIYKDKYINGKNRYNKNDIMPITTVLESAHLTAEKTLIKLMIENRDHYNIIKKDVKEDDFLNHENNILARIIYNEYDNNPCFMKLELKNIRNRLKNENNIDMKYIYEIINMDTKFLSEDKNKLIMDLINTIKYSKLKVKRKEIIRKIQEIEAKKDRDEGDVNEFKILCLKLTELDKELKSRI
ncbi:DNA primase [Schnuerera sp. xch1]|uniref:DNA primase n=1 Tax=Schnuerera sp. xch1 TaxID=2874283 RepID=UPI001CBE038B|nr:DNA primase [Schnuerera sp. xch1]MBZ2175717.1 DNA primase [Schnuerera sp. xch1]